MTFERLMKLSCEFFHVDEEEFFSTKRDEAIIIARHCFRAAMYNVYARPKSSIAKYEKRNHATIINSCNVILKDKQFNEEYIRFLAFVNKDKPHGIETVVGEDGIERITNEAFSERFYKHPTKINERTGLHYFPAFHTITGEGEPTPFGLISWYKSMGYKADEILERSKVIGSFVHDSIDKIIKYDVIITHEAIHNAFPNAQEAQKVKECLLGFINFMRDEEPVILASEAMECGEDFGFTIDNKFRLKSDDYKNVWASDWKTSKVATDGHKMQVEAIRRTTGCDRGLVVVLGNSTKKGYTATKIPEKDHEYLWERFIAIKETAYVELLKKGQIQPKEDNMPTEFSLKDINIKRKL